LGCTCTQPSAANLLKNPGFDQDTSGWTVDMGRISLSSYDADGCPYSGSLGFSFPASGEFNVAQCATDPGMSGSYNFGVRILVAGNGAATCGVRFFPGNNCDGVEVGDDELNGTTSISGWQSPASETAGPVPVTAANSVLFFCAVFGGPTDGVYLDQAFVSQIPFNY
jgi:hypothetical protein